MNKKVFGFMLVLVVVTLACNLPSGAPPPVLEVSATPTVAPITDPPTFTPTAESAIVTTDTASPTPTPQDPLVIRATLCWQGPGPIYEVVSALKQNERVKLLGRGSISGWFVVDNPIYHDPCWVAEGDLQIDAGIDLSALKIIAPPPTATPTPRPTATPTITYTPVP